MQVYVQALIDLAKTLLCVGLLEVGVAVGMIAIVVVFDLADWAREGHWFW